jgi:hypothetical protein
MGVLVCLFLFWEIHQAPGEKEHLMSNWKIETLHDAYQDRPPVRFAVKGLIEIPSLNIIYGAPSTLKSMLVLDLCINLVTGDLWLKSDDSVAAKRTEKTAVLWVDFDNGGRRTRDRVSAVGKHYKVPEGENFFYVTMPVGGLDMKRLASYKELEDAIKEFLPAGGVVVIDNLGYVLGDVDENSHAMAQIMSNFRTIAERSDIAFIIIHHQRKSNGGQRRAGDSLRGHSCIEAALDLAILVEREENSSRVQLRATKVRGFDVRPFGAQYFYQGDEEELREAWFAGLDSDGIERRTEKLIIKFLAENEKNKMQLEKLCKTEDTRATPLQLSNALQRLMLAGKVGERPGNKKEKLYFLKTGRQIEIHFSDEIKPTAGGKND